MQILSASDAEVIRDVIVRLETTTQCHEAKTDDPNGIEDALLEARCALKALQRLVLLNSNLRLLSTRDDASASGMGRRCSWMGKGLHHEHLGKGWQLVASPLSEDIPGTMVLGTYAGRQLEAHRLLTPLTVLLTLACVLFAGVGVDWLPGAQLLSKASHDGESDIEVLQCGHIWYIVNIPLNLAALIALLHRMNLAVFKKALFSFEGAMIFTAWASTVTLAVAFRWASLTEHYSPSLMFLQGFFVCTVVLEGLAVAALDALCIPSTAKTCIYVSLVFFCGWNWWSHQCGRHKEWGMEPRCSFGGLESGLSAFSPRDAYLQSFCQLGVFLLKQLASKMSGRVFVSLHPDYVLAGQGELHVMPSSWEDIAASAAKSPFDHVLHETAQQRVLPLGRISL